MENMPNEPVSAISGRKNNLMAVARSSHRVLRETRSRNNSITMGAKQIIKQGCAVIPKPKHARPSRLGEKGDPQDVYDFDLEVFKVMVEKESERLPDGDYFSRQTSIRPRMRSSIVDWMVEVHKKLKMHTDTLFTAVDLIDLFLSRVDFDKNKLQLLCCTTLLIAAKSEEIYPPSTDDFVYFARDSFTAADMNGLESQVLMALDCRVNPIHSSYFMKRFLRLTESSTRLTMLAHFINETALLDDRLIGMIPSKRAAAVVCLALALVHGPGMWTEQMISNTMYETSDLKEPVHLLLAVLRTFNQSQYRAIHKKYAAQNLDAVSLMQFPECVQLE